MKKYFVLIVLSINACLDMSAQTTRMFFALNNKVTHLYPLDVYIGNDLVDGWDLAQLTAEATRCVRVRRSADDAEQDIGFINGDFDTAGFNAFIGSGDGYIV